MPVFGLRTKKYFLLSFTALLLVAGCEQAALINENVRSSEMEVDAAISTISPDSVGQTSLRVDSRPWYGNESVQIKSNQSLPSQFTGANAITLTFAGPVALQEASRMIESVSNIPVSITNNIYEASLGDIASRQFLPTGGQEVSGGRVVWSGSLQNLLDQLANTYGSDWTYDDGVIRFTTESTKTFMLNALADEVTLTSNATSTSGEATNVPEIEIDGTSTLEIWGEITEAVENIIGEQGNASFSPSTGSITVTARGDVLRRVENYLKLQNQMRLRRIAVSVKVLSVLTEDSSNIGLDIDGVIKGALGDGLSIEGGTGDANGLDFSIIKNQNGAADTSGDITAALSATEGVERASIVHSGSLVTLSDQPAPLQVSRQIAYLERVSSSSGDTGGSVSLEPGTINVGLFMNVLPRIVDGDRILMKLSIAITDADPNFRTFGSDDVRIELPEIDTTGFIQNAVVSNGETLVLAGFEKSSNTLNDDKSPAGFLFGGTRETNRGREMLVLLINSRILPEQPITVIGQ